MNSTLDLRVTDFPQARETRYVIAQQADLVTVTQGIMIGEGTYATVYKVRRDRMNQMHSPKPFSRGDPGPQMK